MRHSNFSTKCVNIKSDENSNSAKNIKFDYIDA